MIENNGNYYFVQNQRIGTSIVYNELNKEITELRDIDSVKDVRIGPPLKDKVEVNPTLLDKMVGLYVLGQVKDITTDLATALKQLDNFYANR